MVRSCRVPQPKTGAVLVLKARQARPDPRIRSYRRIHLRASSGLAVLLKVTCRYLVHDKHILTGHGKDGLGSEQHYRVLLDIYQSEFRTAL